MKRVFHRDWDKWREESAVAFYRAALEAIAGGKWNNADWNPTGKLLTVRQFVSKVLKAGGPK